MMTKKIKEATIVLNFVVTIIFLFVGSMIVSFQIIDLMYLVIFFICGIKMMKLKR